MLACVGMCDPILRVWERLEMLSMTPHACERALIVHFDHSRWIIYVIIGVHMCVDDTILFDTTTVK